MAVLDRDSFTEFVTGRGEVSDWAMSIFYGLFGYERAERSEARVSEVGEEPWPPATTA